MELTTSCFYGKKITKHVRLDSAVEYALQQKEEVDIVMTGPPHGGDESDNEDVDEDLALDVAADLETMVYESEDDTPILNPPKRKKTANKIQWKNENGSFKFTTKPANED